MRWFGEAVHEPFEKPAVGRVLGGGKHPPTVGAYRDRGVDPFMTSSTSPCFLGHGGIGVNQRYVGCNKPQLGDLSVQARSLKQLAKQRCI